MTAVSYARHIWRNLNTVLALFHVETLGILGLVDGVYRLKALTMKFKSYNPYDLAYDTHSWIVDPSLISRHEDECLRGLRYIICDTCSMPPAFVFISLFSCLQIRLISPMTWTKKGMAMKIIVPAVRIGLLKAENISKTKKTATRRPGNEIMTLNSVGPIPSTRCFQLVSQVS